ncbi:MAG: TolC family protein [Phycisphaerales bacterium]
MVRSEVLAAIILVAAVAAGTSFGAAEPPIDVNALQTLPQYLRYAALHNAGLKAAFEEWKAAVQQIPQAGTLPDPKFTYNYFVEQMLTRRQVGIMQTFPWFGKIEARTDAAAAAANAAQKRYEARRLQLFFDVKNAFYEYVYLAGATQIARENLALMRHFEEVARAKYITSAASHPDIMRAQIKAAELENDLVSLERQREPTVASLNAVLNRPVDGPLPWPSQEATQVANVDRGTLIAALKEHNPELRAMEFDVERLRQEATLAKKNYYPDIGLGVEWMEMAGNSMSGGGDDEVSLGVELNLPIWRKSYRAGEIQARAMARRAQHERKNLENDLASRAQLALYELEDSGRRATLYGKVLVPKAEELVGVSEAAYMAGTLDFLSLVDAQQTLLQYRLEYERASTNHQQRLAEIEMLIGADISTLNPAQPER